MTNQRCKDARTTYYFFVTLLEYSSTHLHTDWKTICFLTRFTAQDGTMRKKKGYEKRRKKCNIIHRIIGFSY